MLGRRVVIRNVTTTWRAWLDGQPELQCRTTDGMVALRRSATNRMSSDQLAAHEARLRARTLYWVNDVNVPKLVYEEAQRRSTG